MPGRFSKEDMNPQIPMSPCYVCGEPTDETQSIHGVAHLKCFQAPMTHITLHQLKEHFKHRPQGAEFFEKHFPNGMPVGLFTTS